MRIEGYYNKMRIALRFTWNSFYRASWQSYPDDSLWWASRVFFAQVISSQVKSSQNWLDFVMNGRNVEPAIVGVHTLHTQWCWKIILRLSARMIEWNHWFQTKSTLRDWKELCAQAEKSWRFVWMLFDWIALSLGMLCGFGHSASLFLSRDTFKYASQGIKWAILTHVETFISSNCVIGIQVKIQDEFRSERFNKWGRLANQVAMFLATQRKRQFDLTFQLKYERIVHI